MNHSVLTQIDAKSKLLITFLGAVSTIAYSSLAAQLTLFSVSLLIALLIKRPALVFILYLLMALMMGLAVGCTVVITLFIPALGEMTVQNLLIPFLRGLTMMNLVMGLALSTKIENIMAALAQLRLPFVITLPSIVMIRFIPTFAYDVSQVWETLKIRGWQLNFAMLCTRPLLCARLIFTPILFRALKSSEALGVAAELKGLDRGLDNQAANAFSSEEKITYRDWIALGIGVLTVVLALVAEIYLNDWGITPNAVRIP